MKIKKILIGTDHEYTEVYNISVIADFDINELGGTVSARFKGSSDCLQAGLVAQKAYHAIKKISYGSVGKMPKDEKKAYTETLKRLKSERITNFRKFKQEVLDYLIFRSVTKPYEKSPNETELDRIRKMLKKAHKNKNYSVMTHYENDILAMKYVVYLEKKNGIEIETIPFYDIYNYKKYIKRVKLTD